ncbi:FMN-binding protein [Actinoplanes sp. NPDC051411]|uniref:FMN-binding protein n=1 Tax=Actinoplanes sp. NPDC051411 TaxID=3155522 RepID=UPI0034369158
MRRITLWLFSTVAAVVLLFSYRTSTGGGAAPAVAAVAPATTPAAGNPGPTATATPSPSASASGDGSASGSGSGNGSTSSSASASADGSSKAAKTYTGSTAGTRWGDVQVTITVTDGKITDVQVPVYPNGNGRDQEINAFALPTLTQETLQAQSADIQTVSGATVTSDGYLQSLQSALDAAGLS